MNAQTAEALALANEIRLATARWRTQVRTRPRREGAIALAEVLEQRRIGRELGSLRLRRFLGAARGHGPEATARICAEAGIYRHDPRLRELTLRERAALAAVLRRRAGGQR